MYFHIGAWEVHIQCRFFYCGVYQNYNHGYKIHNMVVPAERYVRFGYVEMWRKYLHHPIVEYINYR